VSRHSLPPRPDKTGLFEIVVGWDRALQTYFVIVFGPPADEMLDPAILLWRGRTVGDLATPFEALAITSCFADIPDGFAAQLEVDRLAGPDKRDGSAQFSANSWTRRHGSS
jgi:hypothetical protein